MTRPLGSFKEGYVPFDYKHLKRCVPKWQAVPMDPAVLPRSDPQGAPLGEITPGAAEATGIPAGLPLIAAAADKACGVPCTAGRLEPHIGSSYLHDGDDQHHAPALHRDHPADPAIPGGDPRSRDSTEIRSFAVSGW